MIESTEPRDDVPSPPDCPRCGTPVARVTMRGPLERTATPCGCSIAPGALEPSSDSAGSEST